MVSFTVMVSGRAKHVRIEDLLDNRDDKPPWQLIQAGQKKQFTVERGVDEDDRGHVFFDITLYTGGVPNDETIYKRISKFRYPKEGETYVIDDDLLGLFKHVFTAGSSSIVVPANCTKAFVEAWGAGGSAGRGQGGGGGGYAANTVPVTAGQSLHYSVAAGGAATLSYVSLNAGGGPPDVTAASGDAAGSPGKGTASGDWSKNAVLGTGGASDAPAANNGSGGGGAGGSSGNGVDGSGGNAGSAGGDGNASAGGEGGAAGVAGASDEEGGGGGGGGVGAGAAGGNGGDPGGGGGGEGHGGPPGLGARGQVRITFFL